MIRTAASLLRADPRGLAEGFLVWWLDELRALVPRSVSRALVVLPRRLVVELGPVVTLRLLAEGTEQVVGRVPATDRAGLAAALEDAGRDVRIEVLLPPENVLHRRLDLPLCRDRDLRALLSYEIGRLTPLAVGDVYYDVRVVARDRTRRRMVVEVVLARRSVVEAAAAEIAGWGGRAASIGGQSVGGWTPTLLTLIERSATERRRRWVLTSLAVLAGLLAIALVFADEVRREAAHTVLTAELAVAKAAAEATKTLEAKADLLVQSRSFLPAQRRDKALSPVFEELARILPDDTWLTSTSIDGEVIRIQGSSLAADRLIQTIDASPLFADAQFAAPVVRSPGATTDRFDITMKHRHGVAK